MTPRFPLAVMATLAAFLSAAAAPVPPSGETHEKLGVALALGDMCGGYRPYEYHFLHAAWQKAWRESAAANALQAQANAVNVGPMGFIEANKKTLTGERAAAQDYRQRAAQIGCPNAAAYYDFGRIEAYLEGGTAVAQAIGMRGQAQVATGMTALTGDQREVIGAFGAQVSQLFGAQMPAYEREVGARAQAALPKSSGAEAIIAAGLLQNVQDHALSVILFDGLFGPKKYVGQGVWLDDGTGFGRYAARIEAPDKQRLWRVAHAADIWAHPMAASGKALRGSMALMLRQDGAALIGLYGRDFKGSGGEVRLLVTNHRTPPVAAQIQADCPVQQCFLVGADDLGRLLVTQAPKVHFYATAGHGGAPHNNRNDGLTVDRTELAALVAAVKK